jgi:hypothetical protein
MSENGTATVEDFINPSEDYGFEILEPTMSETIGKIAGALAKAQGEMTMVEAKSTNPFFNSKYASLASVLETAMPQLNKYETMMTMGFI